MSAERDEARIVRSWLEDGVTVLPDRVLDAVLDQLPATSQRRATWWPVRRNPLMNNAIRIAVVAAAATLIAFLGLKFLVTGDNIGVPVPSPTPSASPVPHLPAGGNPVFPGRYRTALEPALTLTVGSVAELDCVSGYQCRGGINANESSWLDLEFGNEHGSELMVFGLAKVHDPSAPAELVDPPAEPMDLAAMYMGSPGVTVLQTPTSITVGGVNATQLDVLANEGLSLGTRSDLAGDDVGIAPGHETRIIILVVEGHTLVITEQIGPDNTTHDFQAALNSLEPLLESIRWQ